MILLKQLPRKAVEKSLLVNDMTAAPKDPAPAKVKPRSLIPFPRVGRSRSAAQSTPQATNTFSQSAGRERSGTDPCCSSCRICNKNSDVGLTGLREFKRHLIPFPRVGKRQSLIPFPRVGRSHQYVNYPVDEASPEAGNSPDVDTGMFVGSENDIMVPVFNIQGT